MSMAFKGRTSKRSASATYESDEERMIGIGTSRSSIRIGDLLGPIIISLYK
jgi:hypothetical protein